MAMAIVDGNNLQADSWTKSAGLVPG